MAFEDRVVEHPNRWKLTNPDDSTDFQVWDVERDEGEVTQAGTPLNAETFNTCEIVVRQSFSSANVSGTVVVSQKLGFCTIVAALTLAEAVSGFAEVLGAADVPAPQIARNIYITVPYWSASYTRPARIRVGASGGLEINYGAAGASYCFEITYPIV